jgi:class 3 adenylate cyclase
VERPETHYARSGGLAIAYQVHGGGDHDLLLSAGTGSNVGAVWDIPEAARLYERLGRFARVIRYDRRDVGLSDPVKDDLTLEAHADDAIAVMDAVGARRPVLMGSLDGARSLALLAATRPTRVSGLIAFAPSARGSAASAPESADSTAQALEELTDWPGPLTALYVPQWAADPVRNDRLKRFFQASATPRQAARLLRMSLTSDITEALPLVQAPTLVIHPRDLQLVPPESVREFAELIPGARLREVPGDAAMAFAVDVELVADIVEEFITGAPPPARTDRILATVMFTDIVDSTTRAARSGDRAWAALLERHLAATGATVAEHGGEIIKSTGDGVLALFVGPAQGVRCARQIISDADALGLQLRSGLHVGEVERSSDDVAGLAVHLAARIVGYAAAGEIVVSRTVRDLVIGSELTFTARGEHEFKGIPNRWPIYAVNP